MSSSKLKGIIDRFESNLAIILVGEDEEVLEIRRSFLPVDVEEGDILTVKIIAEKNKTKKAKEKVVEMIKKLKNG